MPDPLQTPTGVALVPKRGPGRPKGSTSINKNRKPGDRYESGRLMPEIKTRIPLTAFTPEKWAACVGYICEGMATADAVDLAGIPSVLLNGFLRTDPRIRAQWEEAKLAALRNEWDMDVVEEIMADIAAGEKVQDCVTGKHGKSVASFYKLVLKDPLIKEMYDEARKVQAEQMADEILQIADDDNNDLTFDGKGNSAAVNRSRLKADTRKYIMAAVHHKRWGAKSTQEIDHKVTIDHAARLEEARARVERGVIDVTPTKREESEPEVLEEGDA